VPYSLQECGWGTHVLPQATETADTTGSGTHGQGDVRPLVTFWAAEPLGLYLLISFPAEGRRQSWPL